MIRKQEVGQCLVQNFVVAAQLLAYATGDGSNFDIRYKYLFLLSF